MKSELHPHPDQSKSRSLTRQETAARVVVFVMSLAAIAIPVSLHYSNKQLEIHARIAETSGWDPDVIRLEVGQPLHMRFTSDDVVHGFAVGQKFLDPVDILPGIWTDLTLTFDKPGVYTFYCTRWCGINHWRMRGTLEVGEPVAAAPSAAEPLYLSLGIDLDKPHLSPVVPDTIPSAWKGAGLLASLPDAAKYQSVDYYLTNSPFQVYENLGNRHLSAEQRWAIVAAIWKANTSPGALVEGRQLFAQNCSACHGTGGGGDGVFADDLGNLTDYEDTSQHSIKMPAHLSDPKSILGASPALLQGKILRGGMGTGMPMWGVIFTEEQVWNLVTYIYSFQFEYDSLLS